MGARSRVGQRPSPDDAFLNVLRDEHPMLARLACRLAPPGADVDDILQAATNNTYKAWRANRVDDLPRYLTVAVRNAAIGLKRRARSEQKALERLVNDVHCSQANARSGDDVLRDAEVRAAFERLSDPCREILRMRVLDEVPVEEVAAKLFIAQGTVKSRCFRCLEALAKLLEL